MKQSDVSKTKLVKKYRFAAINMHFFPSLDWPILFTKNIWIKAFA
jgi:hypothetical protein